MENARFFIIVPKGNRKQSLSEFMELHVRCAGSLCGSLAVHGGVRNVLCTWAIILYSLNPSYLQFFSCLWTNYEEGRPARIMCGVQGLPKRYGRVLLYNVCVTCERRVKISKIRV